MTNQNARPKSRRPKRTQASPSLSCLQKKGTEWGFPTAVEQIEALTHHYNHDGIHAGLHVAVVAILLFTCMPFIKETL